MPDQQVSLYIYPWNEMIVSIETMVGLGFHPLSNYFGGIASVHYKANSLLILLHLQVLNVHFILHNIIVLHARHVCSCISWALCFEIILSLVSDP